MRTFDLYAYRNADEDTSNDIRRRGIPVWRVGQAVEWAAAQNVDMIMLQNNGTPASSTREKTHHLCSDPKCPGGCD